MTVPPPAYAENPFSTRFTRPGAMPFLFPQEDSATTLVARFRELARCGAIVGPHGSGKSTLLATLLPQLRDAGWNPICETLHDGQRRLPAEGPRPTQAGDVFVIDGYEQLSWLGRREVRRAVRRAEAGLLVTAHAPPAGIPTLYTTRPTPETAGRVIGELAPTWASRISQADLRELFEQTGGDLRELLFRLYDLYELRRL